jgi:hypothetical protein
LVLHIVFNGFGKPGDVGRVIGDGLLGDEAQHVLKRGSFKVVGAEELYVCGADAVI